MHARSWSGLETRVPVGKTRVSEGEKSFSADACICVEVDRVF